MFSFLSPYGGYIRSFGLTSFWKKLSEEEKGIWKEAYVKSQYPQPVEGAFIDAKGCKEKPTSSIFSFLYGTAVKLYQQKEFMLAEKTLDVAMKKVKQPVALHAIYNLLIDVYYKQRNEREDAIASCITICRKDIRLAPSVLEEAKDIPAFKRLAIILESQGDYKGAIEVSKAAVQYGLSDGTKNGFAGRIEKLQQKNVHA